jgi:hypothetical protein
MSLPPLAFVARGFYIPVMRRVIGRRVDGE